MIEHNLRKVVMNPTDGTLHCVEHGLLSDIETRDVLERADLTQASAADRAKRSGRIVRLVDWIVTRGHPKCRVVA